VICFEDAMSKHKLPKVPLMAAAAVAVALAAAWSCKGDDGSGGSAGTGANGTGGSGATVPTGGTGHGGTAHGGSAGTGTGGTGPDCAGGPQGGWDSNCGMMCHGDLAGDPTPPADSHGNVDTIAPGVGAHKSHEATATWHATVQCTECHPVSPLSLGDVCLPEHANGFNDITWGAVAKGGTYDADAHTCTSVWCHNPMNSPDPPGQNTLRVPTWTVVDGSQKVCADNCHGHPPAGMHPLTPVACELCHWDVISHYDEVDPANSTWVDPNLHVDGLLQFHPLVVDGGADGGG
jgi:hypothetical protein